MGYLGRPIVAVDFDGTIRQGKRLTSKNNRLMVSCKWVIKKLHKNGVRLVVWTTRNDLAPVRKVLEDNKIAGYFEEINENIKEIRWWKTRKIYADYYVDDLNLGGFPGWLKVYGVVMQDSYFKNIQNSMGG